MLIYKMRDSSCLRSCLKQTMKELKILKQTWTLRFKSCSTESVILVSLLFSKIPLLYVWILYVAFFISVGVKSIVVDSSKMALVLSLQDWHHNSGLDIVRKVSTILVQCHVESSQTQSYLAALHSYTQLSCNLFAHEYRSMMQKLPMLCMTSHIGSWCSLCRGLMETNFHFFWTWLSFQKPDSVRSSW